MRKLEGTDKQGQGQQQKIDLKTSRPIVCGNCGYDIFVQGVKARKISKIAANTPQDVVIPFDVMLCGNCGEVIDELFPEQVKVLEKMDEERKNKKSNKDNTEESGKIQF